MIKWIKFKNFGITGNLISKDYTIDFKKNKKNIITGDNGIGKTSLVNTIMGIFENDTSWYSYVSFDAITIKMKDESEIFIDGKIDIEKISDINDDSFLNEKNTIILALRTLKKYSYLFEPSLKNELDTMSEIETSFKSIWILIDKIITKSENIKTGPETLINELSSVINIKDGTPQEFTKRIKNTLIQSVNYINNMRRSLSTEQTKNINKIRNSMEQKYEYYSVFRFAKNYFNLNNFRNKSINQKYQKMINYEIEKKTTPSKLNNFNDIVESKIKELKANIFKEIVSNTENKEIDKKQLIENIESLSKLSNDKDINMILKNFKEDNLFFEKMFGYFSEFLSDKTQKVIEFFNRINEFNKKVSEIFHNKKIIFKEGNFLVIDSKNIETQLSEFPFSAGENQMIEMLYSLLLSDKEIIIIDEPEISLSIRWQRILRDAMNTYSKKNNVLYITHSPFLITKEDIDSGAIMIMDNNE